ncbi:MAG TPA: nucleotidyl transferase AbiEii/AbiGii toxin family protein [Pseudomonadota bacterium]|nr:nucleotidyl transferase AbiEii/AbiGii toxin family protein [Pseudomonadota bacterium]
MMVVEELLRQLTHLLADRQHRWALVGGLAVSIRARPRFTSDVDVAVAVETDQVAESLIYDLTRQGYRVLACLEHEGQARLSTVRLLPKGQDEEGIVVDLLFASSGIEPELAAAATALEALPGVRVPVATIGHLLALKILAMDDARRPQDRADILALLEYADAEELNRAQESVELITARGFHRAKDLSALLQSFLPAPK